MIDKKIILFFFLVTTFFSKAQYFIRNYSNAPMTEGILGIEYYNSHYYSQGASIYYGVNYQYIKFDLNGDTVWWKSFKDTLGIGNAPCGPLYINNGEFLGSYAKYNSGYATAYVLRFNENGDSLGNYPLAPGKIAGFPWGLRKDTVLIFGGTQLLSDSITGEIAIKKIDRFGNILMSKTWQYAGMSTYCQYIDTTIDGGFVTGGYYSNASGTMNYPLVVKFDSNGNYQWHKKLAYNSTYSGTVAVKSLADGSIFCTGGIDLDNDLFLYELQHYMAKLSLSGNLLWEKDFGNIWPGTSGAERLHNSVVLSSNNIAILGGEYNTSDSFPQGLIYFTDTLGNIKFKQTYRVCTNSAAIGLKLLKCDNNRLAFAGYTVNVLCDTTGQDPFLCVVDSMGCFIPGCVDNVFENNLANTGFGLTCYPNPNNGSLKIDISSNNEITNGEVIIMDITGKSIYKHKVNEEYVSLNVADLSSGMYQVIYQENGIVKANEKVIVIK